MPRRVVTSTRPAEGRDPYMSAADPPDTHLGESDRRRELPGPSARRSADPPVPRVAVSTVDIGRQARRLARALRDWQPKRQPKKSSAAKAACIGLLAVSHVA